VVGEEEDFLTGATFSLAFAGVKQNVPPKVKQKKRFFPECVK
jgi:hypothetical protein